MTTQIVPHVKILLSNKGVSYDINTNKNKPHAHEWSPIAEHLVELQSKSAKKTLIYLDPRNPFAANEIAELHAVRNLWIDNTLELYPFMVLDKPNEQSTNAFHASVSALLDNEWVFSCKELVIPGISLPFAEKSNLLNPRIIKFNRPEIKSDMTPLQLYGVLTRLESIGTTKKAPMVLVQVREKFEVFCGQIKELFLQSTSKGSYAAVLEKCSFHGTCTFDETRNGTERLQLKETTDNELQEIFGEDAPKSLGYAMYLLLRTSSPA